MHRRFHVRSVKPRLTMSRSDNPSISGARAAYRIPTDAPEADGAYAWDSAILFVVQGPLPIVWGGMQSTQRGLWGQRLIDEMKNYNHAGLKIVRETMPLQQAHF